MNTKCLSVAPRGAGVTRSSSTRAAAPFPAALAAATLCALGCSWSVASAGPVQVQAVWDGEAGDGLWNSALNWDINAVPNNSGGTTYSVFTDPGDVGPGPGPDILVNLSPTIDRLVIGGGSVVRMQNARTMTIAGQTDGLGMTGLLGGAGTFSLESTGSLTELRVIDGFLELASDGGTGTLAMSDQFANRFYATGGGRLVVGDGFLVRGSGQVGINLSRLTNNGTLRADQAANLRVDLTGDDNFNTGLLEAMSGATLEVNLSTIDSTGGVLLARDASFVDISGGEIIGGELATEGSGQVRPSGSARFDGVHVTGTVMIGNAAACFVESGMINDGQISLASTGSLTNLQIDGDVAFDGAGALNMSNSLSNRVYSNPNGSRLTSGASHLIRGSGQVGVNVTRLTNDGVIRADQAVELRVDLTGTDNFNNNLMEAAGGGTLEISGTTIDNTLGIVRAGDASTVELTGSTLTGGELTTTGSGEVRIVGTSTLVNVHLTGAAFLNNAQTADLVDSLINNGEFTLASTGSLTDLRAGNDVTLTGAGTIHLSDSLANRVYSAVGVVRVTNDASHTIRGAGRIGENLTNLTNNGLIRADLPTELRIDLAAAGDNFNNGVMEAAAGGTLNVQGSDIDNSAGLLIARDGSEIRFVSSTITGGEVSSEGSGAAIIAATSTLADVRNTGTMNLNNAVTLFLRGSLINDDQFNANSSGSLTDVRLETDVLLTGDGVFNLSDSIGNRVFGSGGTALRLTNDAGHTIRGSGRLGINVLFNLTNIGSIIADQPTPLTVDVSDDFTNAGLVHVTGPGAMDIDPGAFTNSGQVTIDATRTLTRNGDYVQTGGQTLVNGTLAQAAGSVQLNGGELRGGGAVDGDVVNGGGLVGPGASPGILTLNGAYTQGASGLLEIEIAGPMAGAEHDWLDVTGIATLGGTLRILFTDGFEPEIGQQFTILTASMVKGEFALVECSHQFSVDYQADSVVVTVTDMMIPQDLNCDGSVNGADLAMLLGAWGGCPAPPAECAADFNGDGNVDGADLAVLLGAWG